MLALAAVTTIWWLLLAGKIFALPVRIINNSTDSIIRNTATSSTENFSSFNNDNSISASTDVASSTTASIRNIRVDESGAIPLTSSTRVSFGSTVDSIPVISSSTASSLNSWSNAVTEPLNETSVPNYAFSFAELLSAITAEFVFNVAGDHVLFPAMEDEREDQHLHTTATVVAELLQKLHITSDVYRVLNTTAYNVAEDMWKKGRRREAYPVAKVLQQTVEALVQDPTLRDEYLAVKRDVFNQVYGQPPQHAKFASGHSQTLYDVTAEQLAYAERLMKDARVKKLIMSVTFFKANQFAEVSVPIWVRSQTNLAKAVFRLAKQPKWRDEVQKLFDEALTENVEKYDAMGGDDESIFRVLQEKFRKNAALSGELKIISNQVAQTKT